MTTEARYQQRIRWLKGRVTLEQVEKYIPTLTGERDRQIAESYLIHMEPSGEIAARYGISTHRVIGLVHKIVRLIQHRVANNIDPADFDPRLRDEREFNYKLKTGMGYSRHAQRPRLQKFLKRTVLTREISDLVYERIVEQVNWAQDGAIDVLFRILDMVDSVDEAKTMLKYVQKDLLEHRNSFGKIAYEDIEYGIDNSTTNT